MERRINKKVVLGMSGGVDSSVSALLLKNAGYEVTGVTFGLWREDPDGKDPAEDAKSVAKALGIAHHIVDCSAEFRQNVVSYFAEEYAKGRTPNPCIMCNRMIKWESLLKFAESTGSDYVATGHYAEIKNYDKTGRLAVAAAKAVQKDQSYVLYRLTQKQLARTVMPLGGLSKDEVRAIAREAGLSVAQKSESQEICFIPDNDYSGFISRVFGASGEPGNFVDVSGNILGRHKGIINYTVGQRKGLGIAFGERRFVKELRPDTNEVVLSGNEELYARTLRASDLNFMGIASIEGDLRCHAKIRYAHKPAPCTVSMAGKDTAEVTFDEAQRAITPGQSVVFYDDGYILGGGIIL